jgi:hypothetical protein
MQEDPQNTLFKLEPVNNHKIHILKPPDIEADTDKLFKLKFSNIYISSKRKSGKTNLIFNIIKKSASKSNTIIICISTTINKDPTWLAINEYFESNNYNYIKYNNFIGDADEDILDDLLYYFENGHDVIEGDKKKYDYILILDDVSTYLKNANLANIMKKARHFRIKILLSSQSWVDLRKDIRENIDYLILFKNVSLNRLDMIRNEMNLNLDLDKLNKIYEFATNEPYSFIYIDVANEEYLKNFNHKIVIES